MVPYEQENQFSNPIPEDPLKPFNAAVKNINLFDGIRKPDFSRSTGNDMIANSGEGTLSLPNPVQTPSGIPMQPAQNEGGNQLIPAPEGASPVTMPQFDTLKAYFRDPSVSSKGKKKMADDLASGKLTEEDAIGIVKNLKPNIGKSAAEIPLSELSSTIPNPVGNFRIPEYHAQDYGSNPSPVTGAENALGGAYNLAAGTANAALHPLDTAKGLYDLAAGAADQVLGRDTPENKAFISVISKLDPRGPLWNNLAHDPVGTITLISPFISGAAGLVSKGSELAGASELANTTAKVSEATNPVSVASDLAKGTADTTAGIAKSVSASASELGNGGTVSSALSTKFNRIDPSKIVEFKNTTGETPGEFLTSRGITTAGEDTVPLLAKNFSESLKQADEGFAAINGNFKYDETGKDYLKIAMEDLQKKLSNEESKQLPIVEKYLSKYDREGLTQSEINAVKRIYQQNNRFSYEGGFSSEAKRSTNILNAIREWQFRAAGENGFTNIAEINKNTQAYRFLMDNLSKKLGKSEGNNAISLADWIILGGDAANFPAVLARRILSTNPVKSAAISLFSGKSTKPQTIKAPINDIVSSNVKKDVIRTSGNGYNSSSAPGLKLLPEGKTKTPIVTAPIKGGMSDAEKIAESKKELKSIKPKNK